MAQQPQPAGEPLRIVNLEFARRDARQGGARRLIGGHQRRHLEIVFPGQRGIDKTRVNQVDADAARLQVEI